LPRDTNYNPDIVALSTMGSIRIDDTLLDVLSADVQNAYLTALIKENYYVVALASDGFLEKLNKNRDIC